MDSVLKWFLIELIVIFDPQPQAVYLLQTYTLLVVSPFLLHELKALGGFELSTARRFSIIIAVVVCLACFYKHSGVLTIFFGVVSQIVIFWFFTFPTEEDYDALVRNYLGIFVTLTVFLVGVELWYSELLLNAVSTFKNPICYYVALIFFKLGLMLAVYKSEGIMRYVYPSERSKNGQNV